jgi:hypothetical protein
MLSVQLEGGLGNKLFQLAFLYSLKKKFPNCFCNKICYGKTSHETADWSIFTKSFEFISHEDLRSCVTVREEHHKPTRYVDYTEFIKSYPNLNINFFGYFQSEKYFEDCKDEIRELFSPPRLNIDKIKEKYPNIENSYFLHVRRGDNIYPNRIALNEHYFKLALDQLKKKHNGEGSISLFICSDDIEWCKRPEFLEKCGIANDCVDITFVEENEIDVLWIMSLCKKGGVAANSTFSWWGGYLNKNPEKVIYFPSVISFEFDRYNNPAWDIGDLIPPSFTKVDVGDLEQYRVTSH